MPMPKITIPQHPEGLRPIIGVPYAQIHHDAHGRQIATCPRCKREIALIGRGKDFETVSNAAYVKHYFAEHAVADGLVKVGREWYSRV